MANRNDGHEGQSPSRHAGNGPPFEVINVVQPALQVGGLSGISGFIVGGFAGVARSSSPTLFALATGVQWLTLGATYTASRGFLKYTWGADTISSRDEVVASAGAGAISGAAGGLLRGRKNVIPGAIMFSIFGAIGQLMYNRIGGSMRNPTETTAEIKTSWIDSKWSPMKVLSDNEYERILREKLLRIDAEIALVDENIEALRTKEQQTLVKASPPAGLERR